MDWRAKRDAVGSTGVPRFFPETFSPRRPQQQRRQQRSKVARAREKSNSVNSVADGRGGVGHTVVNPNRRVDAFFISVTVGGSSRLRVPARAKLTAPAVTARNKMDAGLNKNPRCPSRNDSRASNVETRAEKRVIPSGEGESGENRAGVWPFDGWTRPARTRSKKQPRLTG